MTETESKVTSTMTSTNVGTTENVVPSDQSLTSTATPATFSSSLTLSATSSQETKNSLDKPWELKFWDSEEWRIINDRLDYLEFLGRKFSPSRDKMLSSFTGITPDRVRVVLCGQDPYPNKELATGRAFEVPTSVGSSKFPPTLRSIFSEYSSDLSLPSPAVGNLSRWVDQGVLLWNVIPSTNAGESLAHNWREYDNLTLEVLNILDGRGIVFAFFGAIPRKYAGCIKSAGSRVIECSHPSPRGSLNSRNPFRGSRVFSTINQKLTEIGRNPIDWKLD